MQIAVTLSVAFKGCKATHCNATQSFWWIPDAMTCLLHILILLLFFLIHIELSEAPAFWSYFLNFLLKLYLFSLPPASEDQSLASTAELLSRCPITVLHNRLRNKGHLPPPPPRSSPWPWSCSGRSTGRSPKRLWLPLCWVRSLQAHPTQEHAWLP